MSKLCIIGSSNIVSQHLQAARHVGFSLHSISSLNIKSKNTLILKKQFKIKKVYSDWSQCVEESGKIKDMSFLIAPRIKDTIKVLKKVIKFKKPILVEKPVADDVKYFDKKIDNSQNIFVGYNRIFYKTVNYLKKNLSSLSLINVNCPESNRKTFITNSCHIISILLHCFGDLKIIKKYKRKNHLICILKNSNNVLINLNVVYGSPSNFSILANFKNKKIELSPIEELFVFEKIKLIKKKNYNFYQPIIKKTIKEYGKKFKPGFILQYKEFLKFSQNKRYRIKNNITFAKRVLSLTKEIVK